MVRSVIGRLLVAFVFVAAASAPASAQEYPSRPVKIVVAFAAGGGNDQLARLVAVKLGERWGQNVVVENRAGASGIVGTDAVAKAPADGYTLLMGFDGTLVINPLIFAKLPYDPERDFEPISKVADAPLIVVAHPSFPATTITELIGAAKAQPGRISYATPGTGGTPHMAAELLKQRSGIDIVHIPYKGGGQAVADVLSGQVPLFFVAIPTVQAHVRAGKLKALAVTTARRSSSVPDVPTAAEAGLPGFDVAAWFGLVAPKGTPQPIVQKIHAEVARILTLPDVREQLRTLGLEPVGSTPAQFAAEMAAGRQSWAQIVRSAGIKGE